MKTCLSYSSLLALAVLACALAPVARGGDTLSIRKDDAAGTFAIFREGVETPLVTQVAKPDHRPYLHPITGPDGKGEFTEYSPGHHKHQTGLYWGFTRVNGRDYFHHPEGSYWKRVSAEVLAEKGDQVKWRTVYELLDDKGGAVLLETQTWMMQIGDGGNILLDLEWNGKAVKGEVKFAKYNYGGMFLRMPWKKGIPAHALNSEGDRDQAGEGKRATWQDVGIQIKGLEEEGHIAIFDHPENDGFPNMWRVDGQFGIGPCRARQGDWSIAAGKDTTFRHRLLAYEGEADAKKLNAQWRAWSGQKLPEKKNDPQLGANYLDPKQSAGKMDIKDGFEVNAFAGEPMMTQPMAFCWDDRGRMWIAENRDYETRGQGFSNHGDSRILILEDTDRDGVADTRKVFLENIPFPAAIAVGFDGLWLGAPPNLLFVPDRDGDDKADVDDIEVRLTGWGIRDRHETLNSFQWGPDGWLYGCQGFATPSRVGKPKGEGKIYRHKEEFPRKIELEGDGVDINGGVWRYHPTKDRFEVVAHGFSNPWGLDYDAKGELFITACVIPHLWHVIPGGIYHRQGGKHFNPHAYSDIRTIADHKHKSAHGGARIYLSDAFPADYRGQLFMSNIHDHHVLVDKLEPKGSGYIGRHGESFMQSNSNEWIGFSVEIGPAGNVYILDWHDSDICGNAIHQKGTGRVYRLAPKESKARDWKGRYADLKAMADSELVALQTSVSAWHARRARVILQGRAAAGKLKGDTRSGLAKLLDTNKDTDLRLRALWGLHVTGGAEQSRLMKLLGDADPHIRSWAIQLLCEDRNAPAAALEKFASMAVGDTSAVVRLHLASALQRVRSDAAWSIAEGLVARGEDAGDHNLPKMIWFGIEPLVAVDPMRGLQLISKAKIPLLRNYTARRAAHEDALEPIVAAAGKTQDVDVRRDLLEGALDGIGGRKKVPAPDSWEAVYANLKDDPEGGVRGAAQRLAQRFGDVDASAAMLERVTDGAAPVDKRIEAIGELAAKQYPELAGKLLGLLDDKRLRIAAIRAMAAYEQDAMARELLKRYGTFSDEEKRAAVQTLASRPKYGWELAKAIKHGKVPRADIPAYIARQLRRVAGSGFMEIWGPIDELSGDLTKSYEKYRPLLTEKAIAAADPGKGRAVFNKTCFACHKMYGQGGELGPDITGSNRANLEYILDNILNPSGEIPEGYQIVVITTRDGRTHIGMVASETDRQVTLRVVGAEPVSIEKADIQSRESPKVSLMPQGLLGSLKDAEVVALIRYLRTAKQVTEKE